MRPGLHAISNQLCLCLVVNLMISMAWVSIWPCVFQPLVNSVRISSKMFIGVFSHYCLYRMMLASLWTVYLWGQFPTHGQSMSLEDIS